MTLDSIPYQDIDLNLAWEYDEMFSNTENSYFNTTPRCYDMPTVLIENLYGKYKLQFKKEKSSIKLGGNKIWFNKTDLVVMAKMP